MAKMKKLPVLEMARPKIVVQPAPDRSWRHSLSPSERAKRSASAMISAATMPIAICSQWVWNQCVAATQNSVVWRLRSAGSSLSAKVGDGLGLAVGEAMIGPFGLAGRGRDPDSRSRGATATGQSRWSRRVPMGRRALSHACAGRSTRRWSNPDATMTIAT